MSVSGSAITQSVAGTTTAARGVERSKERERAGESRRKSTLEAEDVVDIRLRQAEAVNPARPAKDPTDAESEDDRHESGLDEPRDGRLNISG